MSTEDQMQVMRGLATNADTPISRSYGAFSVNTKLAFWYELAELMTQGFVAPYRLAIKCLRVSKPS